jgi:hypothetical protein
MKFFPDEGSKSRTNRCLVGVLPCLYLVATLTYSASQAPWGYQVDPESAYAMNGLVGALGYPFMKNDHPGTTTILLVAVIARVWAFLAGSRDVVEFGLKNYDGLIYAGRAAETVVLTSVLFASGFILRRATGSSIAAMLFQVGPFVHFDTYHFEMVLAPDSLMVSFALLGMALSMKAALGEPPPSAAFGALLGTVFAFGLSSKYLNLALVPLGLCLLRNWKAVLVAELSAILVFFALNRVFNPWVFSGGFHWLVALATHKGTYGHGEAGFVDFATFWPNMAEILLSAPLASAIFFIGAIAAALRMLRTKRFLDPISLLLIGVFLSFVLQLVATAKHFSLHYMMASWVLVGGALVLAVIELQRLAPHLSSRAVVGAGALACVVLITTTLLETTRFALWEIGVDRGGARLSEAVVSKAAACANVSGMFVRAPENELNHGGDMALGLPELEDRFAKAYARSHQAALLDQKIDRNLLYKNFHPYGYAKLATEYPCIVVRSYKPLDGPEDLLKMKPDQCVINGVYVYTVGLACKALQPDEQ